MIPLSLLLACSPGPDAGLAEAGPARARPDAAPSDASVGAAVGSSTDTPADPAAWEGVPLDRDRWPAWAGPELRRGEGVEELGDGRRRAWRLVVPFLRPGDDGDSSFDVRQGKLLARLVPAEGPVRAWEIDLFADPERIAGVSQRLSPSGGEVVGMVEPATVRGVLDLGPAAYGFACRGADADLDPDGWCLSFIARTWVETWQSAPSPARATGGGG